MEVETRARIVEKAKTVGMGIIGALEIIIMLVIECFRCTKEYGYPMMILLKDELKEGWERLQGRCYQCYYQYHHDDPRDEFHDGDNYYNDSSNGEADDAMVVFGEMHNTMERVSIVPLEEGGDNVTATAIRGGGFFFSPIIRSKRKHYFQVRRSQILHHHHQEKPNQEQLQQQHQHQQEQEATISEQTSSIITFQRPGP